MYKCFKRLKINGIIASKKTYETFQRNTCLGSGVYSTSKAAINYEFVKTQSDELKLSGL